MNSPEYADTITRYRRFAEEEARGRSPLYEELAWQVAGDPEILEFLESVPAPKRQPNLLFAAVRYLEGTPRDWSDFRRMLIPHLDSVRDVMLKRSTQTNEPGRCAALLPLLASLPQPLALLEVGTSAGLCLVPDYYGYDYGSRTLSPPSGTGEAPIFKCSVDQATPIPTALPRVVWRMGLDLNPLDTADPDQAAWLETLVWPERTDRLMNLRKAFRIVAAVRPQLVRGDLRHDLAQLARQAPSDATLVIFHTSVLAYIQDASEREAFAEQAMNAAPHWIANESPRVFPWIARKAPERGEPGHFLLSHNAEPVAWTDPHGTFVGWIDTSG